MRSYFLERVLPDVGIPAKPSYSLPEVYRILQTSRDTFYRWKRSGKLKLNVTENYRVYQSELVAHFSAWDIPDNEEWY